MTLLFFTIVLITSCAGHDFGSQPHFKQPIKVNTGIFLRQPPKDVVLYQNSAPIWLKLKFEFLTRTSQNRNSSTEYCSAHPNYYYDANCVQLSFVHAHMDELHTRLNLLLASFTGNLAAPKYFNQDDVSLFKEPTYTDNQIIRPQDHPSDIIAPTATPKGTPRPPMSTHTPAIPVDSQYQSSEEDRTPVTGNLKLKPIMITQPYQNDDGGNLWYDYVTGPMYHTCCGLASRKDLNPIISNISLLAQNMQITTKSVTANQQNIFKLKDAVNHFQTNYNLNNQQFSKKLKQFFEYQERLSLNTTGHIKSLLSGDLRILSATDELLQTTTMLTELFHYNTILSDCKVNHLPASAVSTKIMESELKRLDNTLHEDGYELAIPLSNLHQYYQFPFTTCSFEPTTESIGIRVQVPIRPLLSNYQLSEIISLPFSYKDQICRLDHLHTFVVHRKDGISVLEGASNKFCNLTEGYCFFTQYALDPRDGSDCTRELLEGTSLERAHSVCPFICRPKFSDHPIIIQLDLVTYGLTNISPEAKIFCALPGRKLDFSNSVSFDIIQGPEHPPGSFVIKLPCHCKIKLTSDFITRPIYPCPQQNLQHPEVSIVIPSRWTNINPSLLTKANTVRDEFLSTDTYYNFSSIFDDSWTESNVVVNLTKGPDLATLTWPIFQHLAAYHDTYNSYMYMIWNLLLPIAVFYLFCQTCQFQHQYIPRLSPLMPFLPNAYGQDLDLKIQHQVNVLFLTIGILDSIIIVAVLLLLFFYFKRKWTRVSYPGQGKRQQQSIKIPKGHRGTVRLQFEEDPHTSSAPPMYSALN